MNAKEVATELLKTPTAQVLLKVGSDWVEVWGVKAVGENRNAVNFNAVTLNAVMPGGGVMVVDIEPA